MKKLLFFIFIFFTFNLSVNAQDYFSDFNSNANPVLFKGTDNILFSTTLNVGDNSIKPNFFKQYWINKDNYRPLLHDRHKDYLGWGINAKVKTEDGLGVLFSSGEFNPGFTFGGYLSYSKLYWYKNKKNEETFGQWALILSGNWSTANYQLYRPRNTFSNQLTDTAFKGSSLSLSFVNGYFGGNSNLYAGASVTLKRVNNYGSLNKVEIKDDSVYSSSGTVRSVTQVNSNGNVYAEGLYKQYNTVHASINISYIPAVFNYALGFIVYPSVDFSSGYGPVYNAGISIAHLVKGNPSCSDVALLFQLNDLGNVNKSPYPFFKRSFNFGIATALNIFKSFK